MNWLYFALLAPALYTLVTYVDKYILEKEVPDYNAMPLYASCVACIAGIFVFVASGFPSLSLEDTLIILGTGILTSFSTIVYFKAMSFEEASKINILFQLFPLITLVLSVLFLHQFLTLKELLGFLIVLTATIAISLKKEKGMFKLSAAFSLILIYDIMWAVSGILMSFVIARDLFLPVLAYESFGITLGGILIFISMRPFRNAFITHLKRAKGRTLNIILLNEGIFVLAKACTFFAFSQGPVALVSVLEGTQSFFAILYGTILTLLFPMIFHEGIRRSELFKKLSIAILLFIGITLLS